MLHAIGMPVIFFHLVILFFSCSVLHCNGQVPKAVDAFHVSIRKWASKSNETDKLALSNPERSVLSPLIKIIKLSTDFNKTGSSLESTHKWTPSKAEIQKAEVYGAKRWMANGKKIKRSSTINNGKSGNRTDYIDLGIKFTPSTSIQSNEPNLVEVLVFCDYEWGNIFRHDRKRILDYLTVYFYDVNMQYKSLHSSKVSFQVNGIVVIDSPRGQPFIEEARDSEGNADFDKMLPKFGTWVWNRRSSFPKHDIAVAITATQVTWGGGLAYIGVACKRDGWNTAVWNDDGTWGSVGVAGHEIGHNLGAPHDDDKDCVNRGFKSNSKSWAFSTCSDYKIAQFVNSQQASCLKTVEQRNTALSKDFYGALPSDMKEQCKQRMNNREATITDEDTANCESMRCWAPNPANGKWRQRQFTPVENTPCLGGGRCFRARCRKPGNLLVNVGSGECVQDPGKFKASHWTELSKCPDPIESATPLDKFLVDDAGSNGKYLMTPYSSEDNSENGEKCIHTGNENRDWVWTQKCDTNNPWQGWEFRYVGNSWEFTLRHKMSGRCAKKEGQYILVESCNQNDASMRWKLI